MKKSSRIEWCWNESKDWDKLSVGKRRVSWHLKEWCHWIIVFYSGWGPFDWVEHLPEGRKNWQKLTCPLTDNSGLPTYVVAPTSASPSCLLSNLGTDRCFCRCEKSNCTTYHKYCIWKWFGFIRTNPIKCSVFQRAVYSPSQKASALHGEELY